MGSRHSVLCSKTEFTVRIEARSKDKEVVNKVLTELGLLKELKYDENCFPFPAYVKPFEFPAQETELFDFLDRQVLPSFFRLKDQRVTGSR